ncbi:hypothetical protein PIB30_078803 [Stylosanthes scabra]|uniref:Uncharacterized protein n=1 Tax=Stylosanthes scabra TaxID=79078 RepID=A0ABU6TSC2_9FABA|nr:hypothetical protein [Stylosanthes scabra]
MKCLLPSYEPILCDSLIVSSFLSHKKQRQICPDFQQTYQYNHERVQEQHSDPHIHARSTNADPEDEEEHNPEFQAQSRQIQVQQYSSSNSSPEIHNTHKEFNANLDSTKHAEITKDPELLPQKSNTSKIIHRKSGSTLGG